MDKWFIMPQKSGKILNFTCGISPPKCGLLRISENLEYLTPKILGPTQQIGQTCSGRSKVRCFDFHHLGRFDCRCIGPLSKVLRYLPSANGEIGIDRHNGSGPVKNIDMAEGSPIGSF